MMKETLVRALNTVRQKIVTADKLASDWLAERDRRRRQEAAFLRGIIRLEGSQRKAALVTGIPQRTVSRILDPTGHAKARVDAETRRNEPTFRKVGSGSIKPDTEEPMPGNIVNLRRRRPDWQPREPSRDEIWELFQRYLGWTRTAQTTVRMMIVNSKGRLPDAAYENEPGSPPGDRTVGTEKGLTARRR